uniref:NACHT domain-containing protein n=1 Tax=Erpetoichthys calabaricus TaxID=27687 RepID=A0A8C4TKQ5_ERPCA
MSDTNSSNVYTFTIIESHFIKFKPSNFKGSKASSKMAPSLLQAVSESTRTLGAPASPGDPHTTAVGFETRYTELVSIKQITRNHKETEHELLKTRHITEELMDKGAAEKCEQIWTKQLFRKSPVSVNPVNIIAVSGVMGIGKTTMIQKIMYDWARGTQYQRFAFVFLFKFRELNLLDNENKPQMSLTKLIERHYKYLSNDPLKDVLNNPETLLFIFDGLDEYKHKLNFKESQLCSNPEDDVPVQFLVTSLVSQTLLKGCSVLITSRPTALEAMDMERVDRFVEILGFFPEQRLMYCKKFFSDADVGTKAFQYMEKNTILYSMCFNPLYCWIICSALRSHFMTPEKERGAAPRTVTEIFVMFLHNILTNHKLGKMAYYGVENRIHVFNEKQEMSTFGLQPVLSSPFLSGILQRQSTVEHTTYTFYQFTLQEFMTACSFYLSPSGDIEEILEKWDSSNDARFEIVTQFMAGLTWCPVLKTVERILGKFEGNTVKHIKEWVKQKAKRMLQGGDKSEAVRVCHWLCETQNKELIRDAIGKDLKMDFRNTTLSPLDCAVLASVISCCVELKKLNLCPPFYWSSLRWTQALSQCHLFIVLLYSLSVCLSVSPLSSLVSLCLHRLRSCRLTSTCCSALSSALSAPNSLLMELRLGDNNVEDSGVEQLCEGLRSPNCKLETLGLVSCHLTARCCSALSSTLSAPNSQLTELMLDYNNMEDSGVEQLCEGIRSPKCKLEKLGLAQVPPILLVIAEMDSGFVTVSLIYCTVCLSLFRSSLVSLHFHRLRSCRLTARCCSALSSALSASNSWLTELWLNYNKMEDSGVQQLCEGLRSPNCKLEKLCLRSCRLTTRCCSALSSALSAPNSQLTDLGLNENNMEDSGVKRLCEGLRSSNCKIETLGLWSCGLTSACCSALSSVLSSPNSRLTDLDLSNNKLGDSGARQLSEGLRSDNCKLETLWKDIKDKERHTEEDEEEEECEMDKKKKSVQPEKGGQGHGGIRTADSVDRRKGGHDSLGAEGHFEQTRKR